MCQLRCRGMTPSSYIYIYMGISIQDKAQKTLSSIQKQIATMDRSAELPLQRPARHSCKRNSPGKLFGCLLAFCLLAVLILALPVLYLLARHLREPQACNIEERAVRMPEYQKQIGTAPDPDGKPGAHLEVSSSQTLECVPGQLPMLEWIPEENSQRAFQFKMTYDKGFLVIPQSGYYFVYAQVTFQDLPGAKENCGTSAKEITHVIQTVSKLTRGYPVPIILIKSSSSVGEKRNWKHPVYQGAVVKLEANDKLLVNVSSIDLVLPKSSVSFFGAFLV